MMSNEITLCPICHSQLSLNKLVAPALDVYIKKIYKYAHCPSCDVLVLQNPVNISSDAVVDYSNSGYYSRNKSKFNIIVELVTSLYTIHRVSIAKKAIEGTSFKNKNILDIGCGKGRFLHRLKNLGAKVCGLEPTKRSCDAAKEALGDDVTCAMMDKSLFDKESFDLVTLWHVFEHLPDPLAILDDCHEVLKKGGALIIAVPNFNGALANNSTWFNLDPPRHLIHYNEKSLSRLLKAKGFSVVDVDYYYPELAYLGTLQSLLNRLPLTPNFLFNFLKRNKAAVSPNRLVYSKDLVLTCMASVILFPFVIVLVHLLSKVHRSDCITVVAKKI